MGALVTADGQLPIPPPAPLAGRRCVEPLAARSPNGGPCGSTSAPHLPPAKPHVRAARARRADATPLVTLGRDITVHPEPPPIASGLALR